MNTLNYLAEIWGLSLIIIPLALLIKPKYLKRLFLEVENEATMFFFGMADLVVGLAMVLAYNVWAQNWQVIITLLGWISLVKGLGLLFLPDFMKQWAKKIESAPFLPYALVIMVFIGLALTYFGFTA